MSALDASRRRWLATLVGGAGALAQGDYERLAAFRFALRRFQQFSGEAAHAAGLTPTQHQALLSIKGHPGRRLMSIGQLAEHLLVAPHSAAELVQRLEDDGMLRKMPDGMDRRRIGLKLTPKAEAALRRLTSIHLQEVRVMAPDLIETLRALLPGETNVKAPL